MSASLSDVPFRILVAGDFSGSASRGVQSAVAGRRPILVDRDNLDTVIGRMDAGLDLSLGGSRRVAMRFRELDDFHPDRIYERHELFQGLREARESPLPEVVSEPVELQPAPEPETQDLTSGSLIDQIVEEAEPQASPWPSRRPDELRRFVDKIVARHLVPGEDPRRADRMARVDAATSALMRALLHHPDFQALEAAWRGAYFLVRQLETGGELKLYLLDVSKAELAADLTSSADLRSTGMYKLLVEATVETPGAEPWAVVAGNYPFDRTEEDIMLLGRLAKVAAAAGAPFLAEADPRGLEEADPASEPSWGALRKLAEARWVGLAMPRFLLRLPYGKETDPIESFAFEEMPGTPEHARYLWGNPAFACACLLGESFSSAGWDLMPGMHQQIDRLPLHVYEEDGESMVTPCAEVLLNQSTIELILDQGVMPLASIKNRDSVRLVRFQSIADPPAPLAGPWAS